MKKLLPIIALVWLVFALYLSHQTGENTADTSMKLAELLAGGDADRAAQINVALRHAAHVIIYVVLTVLVLLSVHEYVGKYYRAAVAGLALLTILDEATKVLVSGRHCSLADIGLNLLGVFLGVLFSLVIRAFAAHV